MGNPGGPDSPAPGDRWGHYRIDRPLGSGGTATVFAAWDEQLDRPVALELRRGGYDDEELRREARALAALDHPSLVRIHGLERFEGRSFAVMERIEGRSYDEVLDTERVLSVSAAVPVVHRVASALAAIHAVGRIHGDVKPSNILLEKATGRVLLTNVGLSRRVEDLEPAVAVRGTPGYVAPERARALYTAAPLRARQDVYSLAATAFELVTGRPPFMDSNVRELLRKQAFEDPPPPSAIRPTLAWRMDRAILAGLEKRPEERTATPMQFAEDLASAAARGSAPPRILLADDDAAYRQVIAQALAKRVGRIVIESASDGERALEAAIARPPDLAILDLEMPGRNGIELAIALRATAKLEQLPIIVVSGRLGAEEREALARIGVERCFDKPVLLWRLGSAVRELLGSVDDRRSGRYPRADVHRGSRTPDPDDGA